MRVEMTPEQGERLMLLRKDMALTAACQVRIEGLCEFHEKAKPAAAALQELGEDLERQVNALLKEIDPAWEDDEDE